MATTPAQVQQRSRVSPVWQAQQVRDLGLHTSVPVAADILGISKTTAYDLIRRGEFPVQVLRVGGRMRVTTRALLDFLGVEADDR